LSVIASNELRILTLATPADVFTVKSGRNSRVAGDPVQAAAVPSSDASASARSDARDPFIGMNQVVTDARILGHVIAAAVGSGRGVISDDRGRLLMRSMGTFL
jgi:hypothetical protein